MTDELSIQQQPRQNGNYAVAGTVLGAGLGAAAGAGTAYWTNLGYKSKAEYDKVIAMDQDSFKKQIEKAGDNKGSWEKAQELVKKVKDAEAEYDKIVEEAKKSGFNLTELPDGEIKTKLEAAQKAYDTELARLEAIESKKLGGGKGIVTSLPTSEEMRLGIAGNDASRVSADWNRYSSTLEPEYQAARNGVMTNAAEKGHSEYTLAQNNRNSYKSSVEAYYQKVAQANAEKDIKKRTKALKDVEKELERIVENEFKPLTDAQLKEQAFRNNQMVKQTAKFSLLSPDYTDTKGNKYIFKKGIKLKDLRKVENDRVVALQEALANEISSANESYNRASGDMKVFEQRNVFRMTSKKGHPNTTYICDIADIKRDGVIKDLTKDLNKANSKKATAVEIDALKTKYGLNTAIYGKEGLIEHISKRIDLAKEYQTLNKAVLDSIGGQSRIALYEAEMEKAMQSNPKVQQKAKAIKQLAKKYGINVEGATDVSAEAKANAEKALAESFKTDLDAAKKAAEEELQRLGKGKELSGDALTEAIKKKANGAATKEDYTKKIAEEAKTEFDKIAKDLKLNNKWATAAIGAVALGLVGLGIGAASKKSAPEEEIA